MKVGIIGLGFVGLSFASVLGSKGYYVIGVESDRNKVSKIIRGEPPFYESKLTNTLKMASKKLFRVSTDIKLVVNQCDLIFVTVGTPQMKDGNIDLNMIKSTASEIGKSLSKTKNKPIIIIKSTVVPGTTQNLIKPILEKNSKKITGVGFGLITNPEFLREGKAMDDTRKPHIVVIGGDDKNSIKKVKEFYCNIYGTKIPMIITNTQTAEMIKYANNSFLATKISFINQIANICQSVAGTNVENVARAIGLDPRIGNQFLKAGPGYGGSCLPKDLQTLIRFSSKSGIDPLLLKAVQKTNASQVRMVVSLIERSLVKVKGKKITILGLSFKEDSDDIRESVSIKLINALLKRNAVITVHDPKAIENTKETFENRIRYAYSIKDALRHSQCAVIMTPWKEYGRLTNNDFRTMKRKLIIDTRRLFIGHNLNAEYHAIGVG